MPHIFISYAKKDTRELAQSLHSMLNMLHGVTAWMDRSLEADGNWPEQIQTELDRADYVIVLLSRDVNRGKDGVSRRSFVLNEIDYAQAANKTILPVLVQSTNIPLQLAGVHYLDITAAPNDPTPIVGRVAQRFNITPPIGIAPPTLPQKKSTRKPIIIVGSVLIIITIVVAAMLLSNPPANETPTTTFDEVKGVVIAASENPTQTITPDESPTLTSLEALQTAQAQQTQSAAEEALQNLTATRAALLNTNATATAQQRSQVATDDAATVIARSATATLTATPSETVTFTPTPSSTPTNTNSPTLMPTLTPSDTLPPTLTFTPSHTPTITPTRAATSTPDQAYPCDAKIVFTSGGLLNQVHVSPISNSPRRQSVQQGSTVQVLAQQTNEGDLWVQISYDSASKTGWILSDYVTLGANCPR